MSTDTQYTIRPYAVDDNAGLAVMWNESDDRWPGTFTGGVPLTEERVAEWMEREVSLLRLVVQSEEDGTIVGYGSLWDEKTRADACYVDLLNVHPDHQGCSLARRMLTDMVDWATEHDYNRMTIGTWSANLYAMPLYKKVGYFWIPDTQVYMESYLPAIRRLAAARPFFERHDWYRTYRRALEQVEDDERHPATGDMKVYINRWEEDGDVLEVIIDRQAQAVTGLETVDFSVFAVVNESEPAQGVAYTVRWKIANRKDEPATVTILARGDAGIELDLHRSLTLAPGEAREVEAQFICPVDAPPPDPDKYKPAPQIRSTLVIGDQVVELATGVRYRPAVEFNTEPEYPSLLPGQKQTVLLRLHNQSKRALEGVVMIAPQDGLTTDWLRRAVQIDADGYVGLPIEVTCQHAGAMPLMVSAIFEIDGLDVSIAPRPLLLLCTPLGGVSAGETMQFGAAAGKGIVIAENDLFQVMARQRDGRCVVTSKALRSDEANIMEDAGPPFEPRDLPEKQHQLSVRSVGGKSTLVTSAQSSNFPGLTVEREVTVSSSALIEIRYRVVNNGTETYKFWVSPGILLGDRDGAEVALPHRERLIVEHGADFPATHGDFPKKPEEMAEQWYAVNRDGQVAGAIWSTDVVEHENSWGRLHLHFAEQEITPQSSSTFGPCYLFVGPGDWRDVQRAWKRLAGIYNSLREARVEPARAHIFGVTPRALVTLENQIDAQFRAESTRERPLNGHVTIEPPDGWTVEPREFELDDLKTGRALARDLRLQSTADAPGASMGRVLLEGDLSDEVQPFTIIRLGDSRATISVAERTQADQPLWEIDNGRSLWTVAPDYNAGVIEWRDGSRDVNHLLTTFPKAGELGWMSPLLGGIRPSIMAGPDGDDFPGKLHNEVFAASPFETTDEQGIVWRGVQLKTTLARDGMQGVRVELAYLTVGDSNLLKIVSGFFNDTDAYRRVEPRLLVFLQVDGRNDNSVLYGDDLQRKHSSNMTWPTVGEWGVVENAESGRAVALVTASGERDVSIMDWGAGGGHLLLRESPLLAPGGSHEIVSYLALADSAEEAKRYRALARGK